MFHKVIVFFIPLSILLLSSLSYAENGFDLSAEVEAIDGEARVEAIKKDNITQPSLSGLSDRQSNVYKQVVEAAKAYNCNDSYKHAAASCMSFNLATRIVSCNYPRISAGDDAKRKEFDTSLKHAIIVVDKMGNGSTDKAASCAIGEMGKVRHKKMLADAENQKREHKRWQANAKRDAQRRKAAEERSRVRPNLNPNNCNASGNNCELSRGGS